MKSIRYIENRAWFLGANILLQDAVICGQTIDLSKFEEDYPEHESEDILRLPKVAEVIVQSTSLWTMYAKYPDALVFRFDAETDKVIRQYVGDNAGYPMLSLRLAIHASGVLQLLSEFKRCETRSRVVPRSDSACVFTERFLRSGNAGFTKSRRVIGEHVSHPLVGWRSSDQDGWGLRSNLICRGIFEDFHAGSKGNLYSKIATPRIPQTDDQKKLETITDLIAESFDRLYPFLAYLVEKAHDDGVIHKSPHLHFGVPPGEPAAGPYNVYGSHCNAFDAYSYNQHFILETDDDDVAREFASRSGLDEKTAEIGEIRLRWGRSARVWSGAPDVIRQGLRTILAVEPIDWEGDLLVSENGLVRAILVDSLQLSKLAVTSTAQTVYAKLLMRSVTREESLEPEQLRSIMDINNGILQQLLLYEWRLDDKQSELLELLEEKGWWKGALEGFRSAEASLVAATEGLESLASRQLSRATESILFVLTILSVYSIASDVATFLGSSDGLRFPSSPRLGVIIAATAIISLFLVLVRQRRASIGTRRKSRKFRS